MKKIAIIGASIGQLPLCIKAKSMGLETYCFAYDDRAVCKDYVDHFIPISILDKDKIVGYCSERGVDGVVSNASELTAQVASYVAEELGLIGVPFSNFLNIQDKNWVREKTNDIHGLSAVEYAIGSIDDLMKAFPKPCVVKPINGSAKKGVNFLNDSSDKMIIPDDLRHSVFMAEKFVEGKEYSVESISYKGHHDVIQITEKVSTGAPHFVELEHHQPANVSYHVKERISMVIPQILEKVGYTNGASHIEIKIDTKENIYLIEINPRGGGDYISNNLVSLSTDCDYLKQMILVAIGEYESKPVSNVAYAGIYFLSYYSSRLLPYFERPMEDWMISRERTRITLTTSTSNYDRDGHILYCSSRKIEL